MSSLGVIVLSLRGMRHFAQCLESVRWADIVTVIHAGEGEPSVGANAPSSLVLRKALSAGEVRQLSQEIRTDWILHLWGEERVETELQEELRALCKTELANTPSGYRIPIRSHLLGRWVQGSLWGPSPALRLSRGVKEISHGWWGKTVQPAPLLPRGWIGDYTSAELSGGVERIQIISDFWAGQLKAEDRSLGPIAMALWPLRVFMRLLLMNGVFSNGLAGLTLSTLAAYATLLSGAKLWEARNVGEGKRDFG